jgi:hypothetical protein
MPKISPVLLYWYSEYPVDTVDARTNGKHPDVPRAINPTRKRPLFRNELLPRFRNDPCGFGLPFQELASIFERVAEKLMARAVACTSRAA